MSLLLGFLVALNAYVLFIFYLHRSGKLQDGAFHLAGPLLMWRTQMGKKAIDKLSRHRRLWNAFGDVGIVATWIMGILVFMLLLLNLWSFVSDPQLSAENAPPPQYLIGLPGVNPLIPVWYGIAGLVIALVIHEGAHGVLARAHDLKVKSLGLLLFVVPIGAFVEPDEKDLERATPRARNRVFAAGPMSNLVLTIVAGLVFSQALMGSVGLANDGEGVGVAGANPGWPAHDAGLREGDILVELDGRDTTTVAQFNAVMDDLKPGDRVSLRYWRDGNVSVTAVTLADRGEILEEQGAGDADAIEEARGQPFLGVSGVALSPEPDTGLSVGGLRNFLADPFDTGVQGFLAYIAYPFFILQGVDLFQDPYASFIVIDGPVVDVLGVTGFIVAANLFYWLMWLNLMLGTFNALPAGPLDGGQMFRTTVRSWLLRYYKVDDRKIMLREAEGVPGLHVEGADLETEQKLERVNSTLRRATWSIGLFILGLILLPIFAPALFRLFG